MQSTQPVASPQDQSQYATDPLAIDQPLPPPPTQPEPSSATEDNPTKGEKCDDVGQQNQSPKSSAVDLLQSNQYPNDLMSEARSCTTSTTAGELPSSAPVDSAVDNSAVKAGSVESNANPAVLNDSNSTMRPNDSTSPADPAGSADNRQDAPDADTSTIAQPASSNNPATETEPAAVNGTKSVTPNNDAPGCSSSSSSNNSSSTSNNCNSVSVNNGNNNSSANFISSCSSGSVGVKNVVTSDNRIKINGISDLSILDVTEGNDDEIEVKVEGGSLMHKVIKFSLLNGMQDSTKRLENSRLIMSGVSSSNGEATLATTSSLCRGSLGGGPLRQDEKSKEDGFKGGTLADSKSTPPACSSARPESVEASSSFSNSSNSSDSSNVKSSENMEVKPNRTEESFSRLRNSTESKVSGSGNESVHEENVSDTYSRSASLDFREWSKATNSSPTTAAPLAASSSTTATSMIATASTAASLDLSNTTKETDQHPTSAASPPVKRSKTMYYAELPDFSKPIFTAPSLSTTTPTSTTSNRNRNLPSTKSLSQLQMKTPDFSRILPASSVPQSSSSIPPATGPSAVSISTTTSRSHELQIANPDFSKSFSSKAAPAPQPSSRMADERAAYLNQASFAEISKQRNYISDLQLKNPPRQEAVSQHQSSVVKGPSSQVSGPSLTNYRIEKPPTARPNPPNLYRQEAPMQMQLEEPKAHVIHKTSSANLPDPSKAWNPYQQPSDKDRYAHQYPTQGPKGPPPLTSEPPVHAYPGYPPYPPAANKSKEQLTMPATHATHPGGIIVNHAKTYYPEPQAPQALPKSKEPDFRLEHKEKQLRQEGTIITLKANENRVHTNPSQSPNSHYHPQQYHHQQPRPRSPSAEQRESQMMASSKEILYRDFKLKQSYEMPPQPSSRALSGSRPMDDSRNRPAETVPRDRSPYDPYYRGQHPATTPPSKYYPPPPEHHKQAISPASSAASSPTPMHGQNRSPVPIPPAKPTHPSAPSGMHPPSGWPSQNRIIPSPHGGSATSSPSSAASTSVSPNHFLHQKNSPSPVSTYGMQPGPSHNYKSPSPSSSSPSSPYPGPGNSVTKYTQCYPGSSGERVVSIEIDKECYKPGFKGLDYNMEQKFAEVRQAHQLKEKQGSTVKPGGHPYPSGSTGDYPRHAAQHPAYKIADHKPQESHYDEYGRSRAVSTSAVHTPPVSGAPTVAASRYSQHSQENLNYYNQYQYPPRMNPEADMRKLEAQHYKHGNRDPSPAQRYPPSEPSYHPSSKHPGYPPVQPSSSKISHYPGYPPNSNDTMNPSSQYGTPSGKSSYPSSPYERSSEKQPSVISNAYSQERAGPRPAAYAEQRPHPPTAEHYPPGGQHYPSVPQMKATSSQPYPHQYNPTHHPSVPAMSKDPPAWQHYQQSAQVAPPPQAGPSASYTTERATVMRDERQNPVIQPPINKNIPVKVIAATANAAPAVLSTTTVAPATSTTKRTRNAKR